MKKLIVICCILIFWIVGCKQADYQNSLLQVAKIAPQTIIINSEKDTTVVTNKGALLRIPHDAFENGSGSLELEVIEAYSTEDMLRAGLTTTSNGQILRSGGMIYINATKGSTLKLKRKISVAVPTNSLDPNMELFKGEVSDNGKINWIDPTPLPENKQVIALAKGKQTFINNCSSCHAIGKVFTGPDLAHVVKRSKLIAEKEGGRNYLYAFTKNWNRAVVESEYYRYATCYSASAMNSFENFSDTTLDGLYAFIENESELNYYPVPSYDLTDCVDSCKIYNRVRDSLQRIRSGLEKDSVSMVIEKHTAIVASGISRPNVWPEVVSPLDHQSLYYQFTVESFGWYNIDVLTKDDPRYKPSQLTVQITKDYGERMNIYLVMPAIKMIAPAGLLNGKADTYGFFETNGSIPLLQGVDAYIIAIGEYEDKIIFGRLNFNTKRKQEFKLDLNLMDKGSFDEAMRSLQFNNLSFTVANTINADSLRAVTKSLKDLDRIKPVGCDCSCADSKDDIGLYLKP